MKKFFLTLLMLPSLAAAEFVVPPTPHPVNDYSGTLTDLHKEAISNQIIRVKQITGVQVGVLVVDNLQGSSIEEASMKVAEAWKLGTAESDDGVLLMVSIKDRKSRLEIGQGLEGLLTDAHSKRILVEMRPFFQKGEVGSGIQAGIFLVGVEIEKNKEAIMHPKTKAANSDGPLMIFLISFLIFVIGVVAYFHHKQYKQQEAEEKRKEQDRLKQRESAYTYHRSFKSDILHRKYDNPRRPTRPMKVMAEKKKASEKYVPSSSSYSDDGSSRASFSSYSSDYSSSSSSSSSSDWSGGGGGFSGGGSSDSW